MSSGVGHVQVQQGVVEALRAQLISPPQDRDREAAAKLRTVGAELIQAVRHLAITPVNLLQHMHAQ